MSAKFFAELSRRLRRDGIESVNKEDRRLEVFLHDRPVLFVSPGNNVFLVPTESGNERAGDLYQTVTMVADQVYEYVGAVQTAPPLRAAGLDEKFRLLADFGGAVLAGRERENGQGYQFVTWVWDYERTGVGHGHYYEEDFRKAKEDFAIRSGLISKAKLFTPEQLTELYRASEYLLDEGPELEDKQMKVIQVARTKIEYTVSDLAARLEQDHGHELGFEL